MDATKGIERRIQFVNDAIVVIFGPIMKLFIGIVDFVMGSLQQVVGMKGMAIIFVMPNLIIFGIFILLPMATNFVYTFTGSDKLFLEDRPYVGTANIERLFDCENFFEPNTCDEDLFARAVVNTASFVVFQVGLMIGISTLTAVVLNRNIPARGFFRSVFFYPVLLSPIVVALIWKWILQTDFGILNAGIESLGGDKIPFLTNSTWARFWVVFISVWSQMGFYTLILLAGLQAIPPELYEAAEIDGAGEFNKFRLITLPLLAPVMLVVIVLSSIRAVQIFDVVFAFTGGGPGSATLYVVQYIYNNGFASPFREYGLAAATSLVMAAFLVVFTLIQLYLRRKESL
jgi:alpha-1,4-digalacturonate transport system permease protein